MLALEGWLLHSPVMHWGWLTASPKIAFADLRELFNLYRVCSREDSQIYIDFYEIGKVT